MLALVAARLYYWAMSEYLGNPQFIRVAEPLSEPFDPEAELAFYADFLWGKNDADLSQPPRWWFDDRFSNDLVATDGQRWFIPSEDPEFPIREVFVIDRDGSLGVAGLTHKTSYRKLSPLEPGQTATTLVPGVYIQHFWG